MVCLWLLATKAQKYRREPTSDACQLMEGLKAQKHFLLTRVTNNTQQKIIIFSILKLVMAR